MEPEQARWLGDNASVKINNIIEEKEFTVDEVVNKIEAIETKVKFKAFGKTKPPTRRKVTTKFYQINR